MVIFEFILLLLPTDNFCKVFCKAALKAHNSVYKYDFLCVSETFLNSSFESNDKDLMIEGHHQRNHPSNTKIGGVSIYHKVFISTHYKHHIFN